MDILQANDTKEISSSAIISDFVSIQIFYWERFCDKINKFTIENPFSKFVH